MRQFLFGLLCAALVWWGYSVWMPADTGAAKAAGSTASESQDGAASPVLEMIRNDKSVQPEQPKEQAPPAPAAAEADLSGQELEAVIADARKGDADATSRVWAAVADRKTAGASRSALLAAMASHRVDEAGAALAALGSNNAFLHSAEGRAVAQRALDLAAALPPEQSAKELTHLVEKCMRGDIARSETEVQGFVDRVAKELRRQVERTLCNPADVTRARTYTIQKGDFLSVIATRFRKEGILLEAGTIAALNRIRDPGLISAGQKIKLPLDPVRTVIEKRSFLMAVYVGDVIFRLYWVGHGADDKTPVATFTVMEILKNPDWYAPDGGRYPPGHPKNILGKWFVKLRHDFHQGFGIHGTTQPETIGTMASMGCVRMRDPDIEDFAQLIPRGTEVEVRDSK